MSVLRTDQFNGLLLRDKCGFGMKLSHSLLQGFLPTHTNTSLAEIQELCATKQLRWCMNALVLSLLRCDILF